MGFQEAYTDKGLLRQQVEQNAFNDLVLKLVIQKGITKIEAKRIATQRLQERQANAFKLQGYIVGLRKKEEDALVAEKRRMQTERIRIQREQIEAHQRERIRYSIREERRRKLEAEETKELIRQDMQGVPMQNDVIGTELVSFEAKINRFLEVLKYGILQAQRLTGQPACMFASQKTGLLNELGLWANKRLPYMSGLQKNKYMQLRGKLLS